MSIIPLKRCTRCRKEKSLIDFAKDKRNRDGLQSRCRYCQAELCREKYSRQWYEKNKEKKRVYDQGYREMNRDRIQVQNKIRCRRWWAANREQSIERLRSYYQANKQASREYSRKWAAENHDQYLQNKRDYYINRPDNVREKQKKSARLWVIRNPDKVKAKGHRRRAIKKNAPGSYTAVQWSDMKAQYEYTCLRCKKKEPDIALTVDHVVPLSLGGSNDITNIQPLCFHCNASKNAKTIDYRP